MAPSIEQIILQNAQKGEVYELTLAPNGLTVIGIPIPTEAMRSGESDIFKLKPAPDRDDDRILEYTLKDVRSVRRRI